jgi:hypothetical protein
MDLGENVPKPEGATEKMKWHEDNTGWRAPMFKNNVD